MKKLNLLLLLGLILSGCADNAARTEKDTILTSENASYEEITSEADISTFEEETEPETPLKEPKTDAETLEETSLVLETTILETEAPQTEESSDETIETTETTVMPTILAPETTEVSVTEAAVLTNQKVLLPDGYNQTNPNNYHICTYDIAYMEDDGYAHYCLGMDTKDKYMNTWNGVTRFSNPAIYTSYDMEGYSEIKSIDITNLHHGWNLLELSVDTTNYPNYFNSSDYELWYYMPNSSFGGDNIGVDLQAFDWQNKERTSHGVGELIWDDDLYVIAKYRAYQEGSKDITKGEYVSHAGKLTTGENLCNQPPQAMGYFNDESVSCSSGHRTTLMKDIYTYGAIAKYGSTTIFVYETSDWHSRLDGTIANIRSTYGDLFDVKE